MSNRRIGEVVDFFLLLSKILEEIRRGLKRSGGDHFGRKRKYRFLGWREGGN